MEKRERRDGGFGMEMMERRGGGLRGEERKSCASLGSIFFVLRILGQSLTTYCM